MQGVAEFGGIGKHVAGANLSASVPWAQLMPETMNIEGRIDIDRASEYLCGLRWSQTTDVSVVAITPIDEEDSKTAFNKLFQYFIDRKRYGVVGKNAVKELKDTYLVPLELALPRTPNSLNCSSNAQSKPLFPNACSLSPSSSARTTPRRDRRIHLVSSTPQRLLVLSMRVQQATKDPPRFQLQHLSACSPVITLTNTSSCVSWLSSITR